jgi:hypothetical protein
MKLKTLIWFALIAITIVGTIVFAVQYLYQKERGFYLSYGLNLEVTSVQGSYGIPGQTHVYSAKLINFGVTPVKLAGCDYTSDTLSEETDYPYALQRLNPNSNEWVTIFAMTTGDYCRPIPLHGGGNHMVTKNLLPSDSIEFIPNEATGAREPFKHGDKARFVAFLHLGEDAWTDAIYSEPFTIQDNVDHGYDSGYRIKH